MGQGEKEGGEQRNFEADILTREIYPKKPIVVSAHKLKFKTDDNNNILPNINGVVVNQKAILHSFSFTAFW